jgi:hypothetical protein
LSIKKPENLIDEQGQQGTGAELEEQERENAAHLEVGKALNPKYGASSRG